MGPSRAKGITQGRDLGVDKRPRDITLGRTVVVHGESGTIYGVITKEAISTKIGLIRGIRSKIVAWHHT
jgi:hypothetical protein